MGDDRILQHTERAFDTRARYLTLRYSYGRPPRLRERPPEEAPATPRPFGQ